MTGGSAEDWKAATFSFSVDDVARVLDVSPESVVDLMVSGSLGFWVPPVGREGDGGLPVGRVRFDPVDVYAWRDARPRSDPGVTAAVLDNLREYLDAFWPPPRDYDIAVATDAPLTIRERLYVRVDSLVRFARTRGASAAAQLADPTARVLTDVGAVRRRGIRPEGERRQRWASWLRLPDSVWNGGAPLSLREFLRDARDGEGSAMPPVSDAAEPLPMDGDVWKG